MSGQESRLETMRGMLLAANHLYSWQIDPAFRLIYSNCEDQNVYYRMFMVSGSRGNIEEYFRGNSGKDPVIAVDTAGIAWIAEASLKKQVVSEYYLLGPFFIVEANEAWLYQICSSLSVSTVLIQDLINKLKVLPNISVSIAQKYAVMLHYALTEETIRPEDIAYSNEKIEGLEGLQEEPDEGSYHGTWEAEQRFFRAVRDGASIERGKAPEVFSHGAVGKASDNPLRQVKDELIVLTALCCRAVMAGGVSPEGAYTLSDYYIQQIESMNSIAALADLADELLQAFLQRARLAHRSRGYSLPVRACIEYIDNHLSEKISLKKMADEAGYAEYYLSSKFRREVGVSINTYIMKRKIEEAKILLRSGTYSVSAVSDSLGFSNSSYFGTVFKQHAGVTPTEFLSGAEGAGERDAGGSINSLNGV